MSARSGQGRTNERSNDHFNHLPDAYLSGMDETMSYIDYERAKWRLSQMRKIYDGILTEQEELFQRTQPKGLSADKDKVSGSGDSDPFVNYISVKERLKIDERMEVAHWLLERRTELLKEQEKELRLSKDIKDRIYVMRFMDHRKVWQIAKATNYSKQHTYKLIDDIKLHMLKT